MSYALVLLCVGLSTRMGTNKAFLPFGEYTLIEYQVRRFRPYFEKNIFIRSEMARVSGCILLPDWIALAIPDRVEKNSIGAGRTYSCLSAVTEELLFFTPVDAPFTSTNAALTICQTLEQAIETNPSKYACVLKHPIRGMQPFPQPMQKPASPAIIEHIIQAEKLSPAPAPDTGTHCYL